MVARHTYVPTETGAKFLLNKDEIRHEMTGDIKSQLMASDAAKSLMAEEAALSAFRAFGWMAERSVYYVDAASNKLREVDVRAVKLYQLKKFRRATDAPCMRVEVFVECKNLHAHNIIFSSGLGFSRHKRMLGSQWIGIESDLRFIIDKVASELGVEDAANFQSLYEYALSRAYPFDGIGAISGLGVSLPPVNFTADAFRETKGGKLSDETSDGTSSGPVWNAIRSSLSLARGAAERSRNVSFDWIYGDRAKYIPLDEFCESVAFFLDAEIMRPSYFHVIIVVDSRLWKLDGGIITELDSSRLVFNRIDGLEECIDIVRSSALSDYVRTMNDHFEKDSRPRLKENARQLGSGPIKSLAEGLAA